MTARKIIALTAVLFVLCSAEAYAFLEDTPDRIEQALQNTIASAGQASTTAHAKLMDDLDQYRNLDLNNHTSTEIISSLRRQANSDSFPSYVFERGSYSYQEGYNYLYITGRNVRMYTLPIVQNSGIAANLNTRGTDYLVHLGEWRDRTGGSWFYAQDRNSGIRGWIEARSVRLVPNNTFRRIIADIQRGLQDYNLAAMRQSQKGSELIASGEDADSFIRDMNRRIADNSRSALAGNFDSRRTLERMLKTFQDITENPSLAKKSWEENDSYVQKLVRERKVAENLLGNGYKYDEGGLFIYTTSNTNIRQRPDPESPVVASVKSGNVLRYLGERTGKDGAKWYLAEDGSGHVGWVSGRLVNAVAVNAARVFVRNIYTGLNEARGNAVQEQAGNDSKGKLLAYTAAGLSFLTALFGLWKLIKFFRKD